MYTHDAGSMIWIHREMTQKRGAWCGRAAHNAADCAPFQHAALATASRGAAACCPYYLHPCQVLASPKARPSPPRQQPANTSLLHALCRTAGLRALIYSGDHDMAVPHTGSEAWVYNLKLVRGLAMGRAWGLLHATGAGSGHVLDAAPGTRYARDGPQVALAPLHPTRASGEEGLVAPVVCCRAVWRLPPGARDGWHQARGVWAHAH